MPRRAGMDGVRRKIHWDDEEHQNAQWERDTGGAGENAGGFSLPGAKGLSVGNVLARLDLLGTYDLAGTGVFSQAKSGIRATAPVHGSSVPFSWASSKPEESRITNEWLYKSISNGTQSPPHARPMPARSIPGAPGKHGSPLASSPVPAEEAIPHKGADMGIVEWFKGSAGSPDWLRLDPGAPALPGWPGFGSRATSDDAPLLAKLKEKGPPKTLCKNLPKRNAGEQTPFGRERPKLLDTPDAIAMRQAIEAEVRRLCVLLRSLHVCLACRAPRG